MSQSLAQVLLHIVFSTKDRQLYLSDDGFRAEMFRMLAYQVQQCKCVSISVGGHVDHVHLLLALSRSITIAKLVEQLKTGTSSWAKSSSKQTSGFSWQSGYGAFSVSYSNRDEVNRYIRCQAEHHKKLSFQDEFRRLCERHEIELDERYAWE